MVNLFQALTNFTNNHRHIQGLQNFLFIERFVFVFYFQHFKVNSLQEYTILQHLSNKKHNSRWLSGAINATIEFLWAHQDLNLGPPDYESGALTD